jgi:iron complex transport system permease protein
MAAVLSKHTTFWSFDPVKWEFDLVIGGWVPAIKLQKVTLWLSGYIPYFTMQDIIFDVVVVIIFSLRIIIESGKLNLLSLGDDVAQTLRVNVNKLRIRIFIFTSILTGLVVSMTGLIGFIGLIIPQGLRFLGFVDNRYLLPLSFLAGGAFTIFADLLCRLISGMYGFEPPISSITAIVGGPIFVLLLRDYFGSRRGSI